ncbi:hypothetical protein Ahy_B03g068057 [Arachis hypogaea]|uniref:Uncharacterized protein n=1 Tax=Arachis hypogaea TaxID=3818 RepID=A0A445A8H0_ARAHY|nr:hypothetical protein Ahy_B03g068057 [Arachis hypogaea]
MARQVGNDGDINRLNETTHYAGAADFEVSFVMVVKFNDVVIVRVVMKIWNVAPRHKASLGSTSGGLEEGGVHPEACLATGSLVELPQQSMDQHETRVLRRRVSLDRLRFDEALCPPWFRDEEEWGTWLSAVPLLCFNIVRFHHVDRVKRQFNGEQQIPGTPVNLDR